MVLNKGGNKAKKKASKDVKQVVSIPLTELVRRQGEEYCLVLKKLGDGRYTVRCTDGRERLAIAGGNIRKRSRIEAGDVLLVSLRDYQPEKCDISFVYTAEQLKQLTKANEIPLCFISEGVMKKNETSDETFEFDDMMAETGEDGGDKSWIQDI
jgi:translation initiation factor 1A